MIKRVLALLLLSWGSAAWGASACTLTISTVSFGTYIAGSATPLDATGSINVYCDGPTNSFMILTGAGISGDETARTMAKGTDRLAYQLYSNAARTNLWKNPHNHVVNSIGSINVPHTLHGRFFANQDVPPGAYTDTVTLTITP